MRNLDERMAEIGRRSKAVFAKRKQRRKQILSFCIPLELCLLVAFLTFQGQIPKPDHWIPPMKGEHTQDGITDGGTQGGENDGATLGGTHIQKTVKVTGNGWFYYCRAEEGVDRIVLVLEDITNYPTKGPVSDGSVTPEGTLADPICQITVTDTNGTKQIYWLYETVLFEGKTGKCFAMTNQQVMELKKALAWQ